MNREAIEDIYELSPTQQGMLFQSLLMGRRDMFLEQLTAELRGSLEVPAFQRAWQEVLRRHPALRASFHAEDLEKPLQIIQRDVELSWRLLDWRAVPAPEQERRLEALLREDREEGFELQEAPLIRMTLVRTAEQTHQFVWTHHHLLMDGWSLPIVFREVQALYEGFRQGRPLTLPPARPYSDFVGFLQGQDMAEAERFWRGYFAGYTPAPFLAYTSPSPGDDTVYGERTVELPEEETRRLSRIAREQELPLGVMLQGAWALVLSASSGREDVLFGLTVSGRPAMLPGVESIVGPFINTLPLRLKLELETPLTQWLRGIHQSHRAWHAHSHLSPDRLPEWAGLPPGQPLFESLFVFGNYPMEEGLREREGFQVAQVRISGGRTPFPLALLADPGARLGIKLVFDQRFIEPGLAERILTLFQQTLVRMVEAPQAPLSQLRPDASDVEEALRARREAPVTQPREYVAPRNPIEEELARIWAQVLAVERIGVEDDYFEAGGHSLLAIRLISRIREGFQVDLPLSVLFMPGRRFTVASLAETLQEHLIDQADADDLSEAMAELENLSDEEVQRLLEAEAQGGAPARPTRTP